MYNRLSCSHPPPPPGILKQSHFLCLSMSSDSEREHFVIACRKCIAATIRWKLWLWSGIYSKYLFENKNGARASRKLSSCCRSSLIICLEINSCILPGALSAIWKAICRSSIRACTRQKSRRVFVWAWPVHSWYLEPQVTDSFNKIVGSITVCDTLAAYTLT